MKTHNHNGLFLQLSILTFIMATLHPYSPSFLQSPQKKMSHPNKHLLQFSPHHLQTLENTLRTTLRHSENCQVCTDFLDPSNTAILPCTHIFCQPCIVEQAEQEQGNLSCPTCSEICNHIFYLSPYDRGEGDEGGMYRRDLGSPGQRRRGRMRMWDWEIDFGRGAVDLGRVLYTASDADRAIARRERRRLREERRNGGCIVM